MIHPTNTRHVLVAMAAIFTVAASLPVMAQESPVLQLPVTLSGGVDVVTQYFFRGILQEDDGLIVEPYGELGLGLYEGAEGDALNSLGATFGWWNSLHENQTGTDSNGPEVWYETDAYVGISAGLFGKWEAGVTYTLYNSPNAAFDDVQEVALSLGYDDSALWSSLSESIPGFSGLAPSLTIAFETKNAADGTNEGIYLEFSIEPSFTPMPDSSLGDLTVSFPVTLGLSLDDYYESPNNGGDETFGYLESGISLSHPLGEKMSVYGGVHFMMLGSTTDSFNDGDDDDFEVIGKFGFSINF